MKSGIIKNNDSARVSMAGQLKVKATNEPGTTHVTNPISPDANGSSAKSMDNSSDSSMESPPVLRSDVILEEENESEDIPTLAKQDSADFQPPSATGVKIPLNFKSLYFILS